MSDEAELPDFMSYHRPPFIGRAYYEGGEPAAPLVDPAPAG